MREVELQGALRGLANALQNIAPLYLMCDPRDIGVYPQVRSPFTDRATIYLYDQIPGGVGFSERLYDLHHDLLHGAHDLIRACPCDSGCPSCVGPATEVGAGAKTNTLGILKAMRERSAHA